MCFNVYLSRFLSFDSFDSLSYRFLFVKYFFKHFSVFFDCFVVVFFATARLDYHNSLTLSTTFFKSFIAVNEKKGFEPSRPD